LLYIPLAVILGSRFGRRGVAAAAMGGICLPISYGRSPNPCNGGLDIWILGMAGSCVAARLFPWAKCFQALRTSPLAWGVLVLLPLGISCGSIEVAHGIPIHLNFNLSLLFFAGLIFAGMSGVGWNILLLPATAVLVGLATNLGHVSPMQTDDVLNARFAELPGIGLVDLRLARVFYSANSPSSFLLMFACFGFGRWLRRITATRPVVLPAAWMSRTMLVLGLVLGLGSNLLFHFCQGSREWANAQIYNDATVAFFAVLGGLLLGRSGIYLVGAIVASVAYSVESEVQEVNAFCWACLEVAAFGWSGLLIRRAWGVPGNTVPTGALFRSLVFLLFLTMPYLAAGEDEPGETPKVYLLLIPAAGLILIFLSLWLRKVVRRARTPAYKAWILLFILAGVICAAVANFAKVKELILDAAQQIRFVTWASDITDIPWWESNVLFILLLIFWGACSALRTIAENFHHCLFKGRIMFLALAGVLRLRRVASRLAAWHVPDYIDNLVPVEPGPSLQRRVVQALRWASRAAWVLSAAFLLITQFQMFWPALRDAGKSDSSLEAPETGGADPVLVRAALAFAAKMPNVSADLKAYPAVIETGWCSEPDNLATRTRYKILVDSPTSWGRFTVIARVQVKRHHIWLEDYGRSRTLEEPAEKRATEAIDKLAAH
jgi:hypothetical protein